MSDLQCPARIVLLDAAVAHTSTEALQAERVAHVYADRGCGALDPATALAAAWEVVVTGLDASPGGLRTALEDLADLHRGETVVVVTHGGAMSAVLACWGWAGRDRDVAPCERLVLERDGDGWRQCGRVGRTFIGELPDGGRAIPTTLRDGGSGQTA